LQFFFSTKFVNIFYKQIFKTKLTENMSIFSSARPSITILNIPNKKKH